MINQNGMILLNKAVRELSDEEFFAELDAIKSERTKKRAQEMTGKSADEMFQIAMSKATVQEAAND